MEKPIEPGPHATAAEKAEHAQAMADWTAENPDATDDDSTEWESPEEALQWVGSTLESVRDMYPDGPQRVAIEEAMKLIAAAISGDDLSQQQQADDKSAKQSRSRTKTGPADSSGGDVGSNQQ